MFLAPRIAKLHALSHPFARGLVREAKRMLHLCILRGEAVAPSRRVDLAWHEMMLFTRWYRDFSDFIGGFVDHDPTPPSSLRAYLRERHTPFSLTADGKKKDETPLYAATKRAYEEEFGMTPDPRYWP